MEATPLTTWKAVLVASSLLITAILHADCPEGSRTLNPSEQQSYVSMVAPVKAAIPPAPAGWVLKDPAAKMNLPAPTSDCKGLDPSPGYDVSYFWDEQYKRNGARDREQDIRLKAASKSTPEEQKAMDDLDRPSRDLERKAQLEIRNSNPDEAARLRAQSKELHDKSNAVRAAHNARIAPELEAIRKEFAAGYVNPNFNVHVVINDDNKQLAAKERLQIAGVPAAFFDAKDVVMSFGHVPPAKATGGVGTKPARSG
jgi:hypothetical protein